MKTRSEQISDLTNYQSIVLTRAEAATLAAQLPALGFHSCAVWRTGDIDGGFYAGAIHSAPGEFEYRGFFALEQARRYAAGEHEVAV